MRNVIDFLKTHIKRAVSILIALTLSALTISWCILFFDNIILQIILCIACIGFIAFGVFLLWGSDTHDKSN